jgi:hypothetical protein
LRNAHSKAKKVTVFWNIPIQRVALLVLILAGLQTSAYGEGDEVVLRVGVHEVSESRFESGLTHFDGGSALEPGEARRRYLDSLVDRYLILQEAENRGLIDAAGGIDLKLQIEDQIIAQRVREDETRVEASFTKEEMRQFYDRHAVLYDVQQILVATEEEAREVLGHLGEGHGFEELARELSVDAKSRLQGGRLTPFVWSATRPLFMNVLSTMNPGDISEPVRSEVGFHIFRLNSRIPRAQEPYEQRRDGLEEQLMASRLGEEQSEFYQSLEKRFGFELNLGVAILLADVFAAELDRAEGELPEVDLEQIAAQAIRRVKIPDDLLGSELSSSELSDYTVHQNWDYLQSMPPILFVDRRNPHMILNDARADFIRKALPVLGRDRNLQEDPQVKEKTEQKLEEIARALLLRTLEGQFEPITADEERSYYEQNPERFVRPGRIRVQRVRYSSEGPARALEGALVGDGVNPSALMDEHFSEGLIVSREHQSDWISAADDPWLVGLAETMDVGGVGLAPDPEGYWNVLMLLARDSGGVVPFEDARETIRKDLESERREESLALLVESLRKQMTVWVNPQLVSRAAD